MEQERKIKVLVVDDETTVCQSVKKVLSRMDVDVEIAHNAREALAKLKNSPRAFGTALIDLIMPEVSGVELLKVIKAYYPSLPVIIITGYASIDSAVETTKLGAFEYLPKPFTPQELVDVCERAINKYLEEQKKLLSELNQKTSESAEAEPRQPLDVDLPFSEKELRSYTSEQYVESIDRSDIPRHIVAEDYCAKGKRRCPRFARMGRPCEGECPFLKKEAEKRAKLSVEGIIRAEAKDDVIDVDMPFKVSEVMSATCPEYAYALTRSDVPLAGKWSESIPTEKRVLVVDDEPVVCQSVKRILEHRGFEVHPTMSGKEALSRLESTPYDIVLLDLRMPDMDGYEMLQAIKERWPDVKVIVITGYASVESAVKCIRTGAEEYLAKPFTPSELVAAAVSVAEK
ncbi:response regulator [Candidatus Sumerlaeota bacterium]|nr:response regulator [Candidatus Sumerlaeota bacterium]